MPFTAHLGVYRDETAAICTWHLPLSHVLESWSDIRAFDGTASIIQPLIRPLYDSRMGMKSWRCCGGAVRPPSISCANSGGRRSRPAIDDWWRQSLHDGVVAGHRAAEDHIAALQPPQVTPAAGATTDTRWCSRRILPSLTAAWRTMRGCRSAQSRSPSRSGAMGCTCPR